MADKGPCMQGRGRPRGPIEPHKFGWKGQSISSRTKHCLTMQCLCEGATLFGAHSQSFHNPGGSSPISPSLCATPPFYICQPGSKKITSKIREQKFSLFKKDFTDMLPSPTETAPGNSKQSMSVVSGQEPWDLTNY